MVLRILRNVTFSSLVSRFSSTYQEISLRCLLFHFKDFETLEKTRLGKVFPRLTPLRESIFRYLFLDFFIQESGLDVSFCCGRVFLFL
jgi:hypothetical protein